MGKCEMGKNEMKKVCVVITARPSYARIKTAICAMKNNPKIDLEIVLAASSISEKYGNIEKIVEKDGFKIAAKVFNLVSGESVEGAAKTTGLGIIELTQVFLNIKPDYVITVADRYETMATAVAAAYMNIPLIHIQGGEVTGNIDEKVRHAITKLADVHIVSNEDARERVKKMGENPDRIFVTGCPSIDIAKRVKDNYHDFQFDPHEKYAGVGKVKEQREKYVVVMYHPVTTNIGILRQETDMLLETVNGFGVQVYWFWPNADDGSDIVSKCIRCYREDGKNQNILFFKNMEPEDFLALLLGAQCIIGNSSVGIRECSYLGVPAINIGSRQNRRLRGKNVIDIENAEAASLVEAYERALVMEHKVEYVYGDGSAGEKIAQIVADLKDIDINKEITY